MQEASGGESWAMVHGGAATATVPRPAASEAPAADGRRSGRSRRPAGGHGHTGRRGSHLRRSPGTTTRRFFLWLSVIVAGGLAWRVAYVMAITRYENAKLYDAAWYELQGLTLTGGHFFPVLFGHGPDAAHPPLTSLAIVPATWLFGLPPGFTPQRLTMALLGAATVALVGILGRALAGPRAGLLAALVAAAYPNMWLPNGIVMSETLTMLTVVLALLAAYRLLRAPSWWVAALLGAACGLAALTRAELALLVPFLAVPAALSSRCPSRRRRFCLAGVTVLVSFLAVGPWVGRNLASFREPTFLSTGEGPVLLGANCPGTYGGPLLGSWDITCSIHVRAGGDQSVRSARQTSEALRFIRAHEDRLPVVVAARIGRAWDFFDPLQMAQRTVDEGRPVPASLAGVYSYYLLLPLAVLGAVALRRRHVPVWPLLELAGVVTLVVALSYGLVRFRAEFEPALVVLAGVGLDALWRAASRRWVPRPVRLRRREPPPGAARPPAPG